MKRTIIITGASGKIGEAIVKVFAKSNNNLVLVGRRKSALEKIKKEINSDYLLFPMLVEKFSRAKNLASSVVKRFGRIDVLVNTAGILGPAGEFHTINADEFEEALKINLFGTANMCRAVLPFMVRQRNGKIINFSGGGAVQPFANFTPYAVSKAAVVRFTENLAAEYKKYNVQINAVAPGMINSKFLSDALKLGMKKTGKEYYQKVLEQKKSGGDDPVLAASLVAFLAAPKNKLTGKLISAKWDKWKKFGRHQIEKINQSSLFTLRRIDNKYFYEK